MAAAPLSAAELRDLCVELTAALAVVYDDVDVAASEWEPPRELRNLLVEREALVAALASAPEDVRGRLRTVFKRERERLEREDKDPKGLAELTMPQIVMEGRDLSAAALRAVHCARKRDRDLHVLLAHARDIPAIGFELGA